MQFSQHCKWDLRSYILEGLSDYSHGKPPSAPENPARFHREEMLGRLPSAHLKVYITPVHVTTQVFTEENNALHCTQKPTD